MYMPRFRYVRIQGKELARNTMFAKGIFSMCWQLIQQDVMIEEDADLFREIDSWFSGAPCPSGRMHSLSDGFAFVGFRRRG